MYSKELARAAAEVISPLSWEMKASATLDLFGCQKLYGFVKMLHFQLFFEERFLKFAVLLLETKYNFFLFLMAHAQLYASPRLA